MTERSTDDHHPLMRVFLFGGFKVERLYSPQGEPPCYQSIGKQEWKSRGTAQTLLKVLLCSPARRASKESLIEAIWPGEKGERIDTARALQAADSILRSVLRTKDEASLLLTTEGTDGAGYQLESQHQLWVDVDACEQAIGQAIRARSSEEALLHWEAAAQFLQGVFLPDDVFSEWSQVRRRRFEGNRRLCVHRLAKLYLESKRDDEAEVLLRTFWADNLSDEDVLCLLMTVLAQHGRHHEALHSYEQTVQFLLQELGVEPQRKTRQIAEQIRQQMATSSTFPQLASTKVTEVSSSPALSSKIASTVDTLLAETPEMRSEHSLGAYFALGVRDLTPLFENGWPPSAVLDSLHALFPIARFMSTATRQSFFPMGTTNATEHAQLKQVRAEEQMQLYQAFYESIDAGWKLFMLARNAQALAVSQAQLMLLQQAHLLLPMQELPALYTAIYNFMGMALCHEKQYHRALQAHTNAYIAAIGAGNAPGVIDSLRGQAVSYQELGQYSTAIQVLKQALRTFEVLDPHLQSVHTKAHLLGFLADCAMTIRDYTTASERLDSVALYLDDLGPNMTFDRSNWYQFKGKYAYLTGDYIAAAHWYERALSELPFDWTIRRGLVLMSLLSTYTNLQDRDACLLTAEKVAQLIPTLNAPHMNTTLTAALQGLLVVFPYEDKITTLIPPLLRQIS